MIRLMKIVVMMVALMGLTSINALAQCSNCDFNAQGSATIPGIMYYYSSSNTYSLPYIMLTNTSSTTICCQVNMYGSEGENLTSYARVKKGGPEWVTVLNGVGTFEIPPHETRCCIIHFPSSRYHTYGHAIVEWKSSDPLQKNALIGGCDVRSTNNGVVSTEHIPINNGKPF